MKNPPLNKQFNKKDCHRSANQSPSKHVIFRLRDNVLTVCDQILTICSRLSQTPYRYQTSSSIFLKEMTANMVCTVTKDFLVFYSNNL